MSSSSCKRTELSIIILDQWLASEVSPIRTSRLTPMASPCGISELPPSLPCMIINSHPARLVSSSYCEAQYAVQRPPVPYANQTEEKSLVSEKGFKSVRGYLTEGRFLTFEASGYALTNLGAKCATYNATKAVASHDGTGQRWVIHETATDSRLYTISTAVDGRYIGPHLSLVSQKDALVHSITYLGGGKGYEVLNANGKYITIDTNGTVVMATSGQGFTIYSVT
ncbi:hypothetical protein EDD37DRAFT_387331 [Exophiala viscosa]|uniref:uncharacterized protein n=1 Tax=Exophiala viscosa TaxID=2486360 RepID=UPI00219773CF|nr:hypothetical protein EDD37DRAFT_387331 [Exophiala viscosa]